MRRRRAFGSFAHLDRSMNAGNLILVLCGSAANPGLADAVPPATRAASFRQMTSIRPLLAGLGDRQRDHGYAPNKIAGFEL